MKPLGKPVVGTVRRWQRTPLGRIDPDGVPAKTILSRLDALRETIQDVTVGLPNAEIDVCYDDGALHFDLCVPEFWTEASVAEEFEKRAKTDRRVFLLSQQRSIAQAIGFKVFLGEPHDDLLEDLKRNKAALASLD